MVDILLPQPLLNGQFHGFCDHGAGCDFRVVKIDAFGQEISQPQEMEQFRPGAEFLQVDRQFAVCNREGTQDAVVVVVFQTREVGVAPEVVEQVGIDRACNDLPHPWRIETPLGEERHHLLLLAGRVEGVRQFVLGECVSHPLRRIVPREQLAFVFEGMAEWKVTHVVYQGGHDNRSLLFRAHTDSRVSENPDYAPGHRRRSQRMFEPGMRAARIHQIGRAGLPDAPKALELTGIHQPALDFVEANVAVDRISNDHLTNSQLPNGSVAAHLPCPAAYQS